MARSHEIYLIRHGVAEERGDTWPDDTKRPLTEHSKKWFLTPRIMRAIR